MTQFSPLKLTNSFRLVYRRGRWAHGSLLSVGVWARQTPPLRVGLRTKKGLKGAVVRNRLKRQMRAILAARKIVLQPGHDVVIVLHPPHVPVTTQSLEKELKELCQRARILCPPTS